MTDFTVESRLGEDHVAVVEFRRGANNFFSQPLVAALADELERLATTTAARAVVLCAAGSHFCAGADLARGPADADSTGADGTYLYDSALRLFVQPLPVVAAVQGAAVGGGLGLAMACDFRTATPDTRFAAPFARLGLHHGFGLTLTLPRVVGQQRAAELLYSGRRVPGQDAYAIGLCDRLVTDGELRSSAHALAREIATAAPLAVRSIRQTMRSDLQQSIAAAMAHEKREQALHRTTEDLREGIRADHERRKPIFHGR